MSEELHNLFFIKEDQIQNSKIILTGPEFHHIKNVLRKKSGEAVYFTDGKGNQYKTEIEQTLHNAMIIKVIERKLIINEKPVNLDLGLVSLKTGRTDLIIEKGTELGVHKFIFFVSQHAVIRNLKPPRIEHFKKIALSAMLQSQQYYLPDIVLVDDIIKEFANYDAVIVGDKDGKDRMMPGVMNILLLVGPEGGFSPQEISAFLNNKAKLVSFGRNRLRSETAAIAGIVNILSYYNQ
ncbi:MAG: RsmE family RNA methyltransferase [candidate division WOR-3 bacterium]